MHLIYENVYKKKRKIMITKNGTKEPQVIFIKYAHWKGQKYKWGARIIQCKWNTFSSILSLEKWTMWRSLLCTVLRFVVAVTVYLCYSISFAEQMNNFVVLLNFCHILIIEWFVWAILCWISSFWFLIFFGGKV